MVASCENVLGFLLGFRPLLAPSLEPLAAEEGPRISTGVRSLDELLEGGVEVGSLTEFIGEFGAGKTQLCHQLAVMVQLPREKGGLSARALYIDTEGTFRPERIIQIARYRNLDPEKTLENILYARAYNSDHLLHLLEKSSEAVIGGDVGLLVLDEATGLFRAELEASERVEAFAKLSSLLEVAARAGAAVVFTRHVVAADEELPAGGAAVDGLATVSVRVARRGEVREAEVISSPWRRRVAYFLVGDKGAVDV
ncbi:MAG: AAA family ATPase [Thermofilum sp.]